MCKYLNCKGKCGECNMLTAGIGCKCGDYRSKYRCIGCPYREDVEAAKPKAKEESR